MREIQFPYGRGHLTCALEEERLNDVLLSGVESYVPEHDQQELVRLALENPVGQPRLSKLAEGKKNIVVITSDHTRPVPSKITLPPLLEEIRRGAPQADITILVATGCHRSMTEAEQLDKFGEEVCRRRRSSFMTATTPKPDGYWAASLRGPLHREPPGGGGGFAGGGGVY